MSRKKMQKKNIYINDMLETLNKRTGFSKKDLKFIIEHFIYYQQELIKEGEKICIQGFYTAELVSGKLTKNTYGANNSENIKKRKRLKLKASLSMRENI